MKSTNHARGITLIEVIGCAVVLLILAAVLFPMCHCPRVNSRQANCQSNLKQIGVSINTYLSDWNEHYPTNRPLLANGKLGPVSNSVQLSKVGTYPGGKPIKFQHGITWVEGLYRYIEPISAQDDAASVWKCRAVCNDGSQATSKSAAVNYVFNRNMVEKTEDEVRNPATLMMAREVDRLVNSDLRPTNDSTTKDQRPQSAFLTDNDSYLGQTNPKLHSNGSSILFADGHVRIFDSEAFSSLKWERAMKTWTNADNRVTVSP